MPSGGGCRHLPEVWFRQKAYARQTTLPSFAKATADMPVGQADHLPWPGKGLFEVLMSRKRIMQWHCTSASVSQDGTKTMRTANQLRPADESSLKLRATRSDHSAGHSRLNDRKGSRRKRGHYRDAGTRSVSSRTPLLDAGNSASAPAALREFAPDGIQTRKKYLPSSGKP